MGRLRFWLPMSAMLLSIAILFPMVNSGYELTRIRNSMIASPGDPHEFEWKPERPPVAFLQETAPPPLDFQRVAATIRTDLGPSASNLEVALALAQHLGEGPGPGGGGIKSSTRAAYREILTSSRGYCADYTQVMNGLAYAAGVPVREWGMSFEGYSGNGHAFNEVYDYQLSKWVFLDSFYSFYVIDRSDGRPVSSLELRERLASGEGEEALEVRVISEKQFGFKNAARALEYYRQGTDQFFLYFGNNVFSYDAHPVVAALSPLSRAMEESVGIALGIRPEIRLLRTETNREEIEGLFFRRKLFLSLGVVVIISGTFLAGDLLSLCPSSKRLAAAKRSRERGDSSVQS